MANRAKQKGTQYETQTRKYLEEFGIKAKRNALSGGKDIGDLSIDEPFIAIVENKAYKSDLTDSQIQEFRRQTEVEAENYKNFFKIQGEVKGLLFVKNPGKSIGRTRVSFYSKRYNCWLTLYLYEFVEHWKDLIDDIR